MELFLLIMVQNSLQRINLVSFLLPHTISIASLKLYDGLSLIIMYLKDWGGEVSGS